MTARIHLIERLNHMGPVARGSTIYESGWWAISAKTAERLKGGNIYFHKAQAKDSYFGGVILDYRIETEGEWVGRIIFKFQSDPACRGVSAGKGGWGMEKKILGAKDTPDASHDD